MPSDGANASPKTQVSVGLMVSPELIGCVKVLTTFQLWPLNRTASPAASELTPNAQTLDGEEDEAPVISSPFFAGKFRTRQVFPPS